MRTHTRHHTREHRASRAEHAQRKITERLAIRQVRHESSLTQDWDPAQVEAACRSLAAAPAESISRISVVLPCSGGVGRTMVVMEYSRALANEFGLRVHCDLYSSQIAITFERTATDSSERAAG